MFHAGGNDTDVVIDDVVLKRLDPTSVNGSRTDKGPDGFVLHPAFPNPFNSSTQLLYHLPMDAKIRLTVYDSLGREIETLAEGFQIAGHHNAQFNAANLSSGLYLCVLKADYIQAA